MKELTVEYFPAGKWKAVDFKGEVTGEDIEFLKQKGYIPHTYSPSQKNAEGHFSLLAEDADRAKKIIEKLKPLLEEKGFSLVSKL